MPDYPFPTDPDALLTTDRLILEPLRGAHAARLFDVFQDAAVFRYVPQDPPGSLDWLAARYAALETRQSGDGGQAWLQWAVRLSAEPTYVGTVEATVQGERPAAVAWMLGAAWWRRGIATEAMTRVLAQLAGPWRVPEAYVEIDERNVASLALAARLGFVEVARTEDADFFKGETSHERRMVRVLHGVAEPQAPLGRPAGYGG